MRAWSYVLGGMIAWTCQFVGLYAFASLEAQTRAQDTGLWQAFGVALSLLCALPCGVLMAIARRRLRIGHNEAVVRLLDQLCLLGACAGLIAIVWQTCSALIV